MSWVPHRGAQEEFLSRSEFEVLFGGAAGPGKTDCLIAAATRNIKYPVYHGLLIRRTFPQLQEIIDRCWRLFPHLGGEYRATDKRWCFPSGAVIDLGHMQHEIDKYNYQGKEFHFVGIDELTQFTETMYTYLFSRLRTTDPAIQPQILSTTNPGGIGHNWVKERFVSIGAPTRTYVDAKTGLSRVFIPATMEDNPTLLVNDPVYLARLSGLPELEMQRLRYGIWDAFEGQVFTELSARIHGCEPFDIPPEWERYCILDWGFAKPFVVYWAAVDYDDVLYIYREWYGCKREVEGPDGAVDTGLQMVAYEVARGILDQEKDERDRRINIRTRIADPSIWHTRPDYRKKEARGPTIHEDMMSEGLFFQKGDNDRAQGKMQFHKRLKLIENIDESTGEVVAEYPQVRIFNTCKGFWRTVPNLVADEKNAEDIANKQEDHCYDAVRYLFMSRPVKPRKVETMPTGTFRAEREKLIRAKKVAARRGISVAQAYNRTR